MKPGACRPCEGGLLNTVEVQLNQVVWTAAVTAHLGIPCERLWRILLVPESILFRQGRAVGPECVPEPRQGLRQEAILFPL